MELAYLVGPYSETTLRGWVRRLRVFRFWRSPGGQSGYGDELTCAYPYATEDEVRAFFAHVGLPVVVHAEPPPKPTVGKRYTMEEMAKFRTVIPGTAYVEEPGPVVLDGVRVHVRCPKGELVLTIGKDLVLTEEDVVAAETLERRLAGAPLAPKDPPIDDPSCVSPKHWAEWFA